MTITQEDKEAIREFKKAVNMSGTEITKWLETQESKAVGFKGGGGESVGHRSGRRIIGLLEKKQDELTESDLRHVRKVVGYIHRHLAQRPAGDVSETPWRYSLMNWGHDPVKKG